MRLPLSVQSWDGKSREFTAEKLVNYYVEVGPASAKSPALLLNRPMLSNWLSIGSGPIRGWILMGGDLYVVGGSEVHKITSGQATTLLGTITGSGPVSIAENGSEVAIVSDKSCWVATSSDLTKVTSSGFPGASTVVFLDTFGVFTEPDSGRYFISGQLDFSSFDPLDNATAEGDPDDLVAVATNHRWLWLFGEKTIQVHYNTGGEDFPYELLQDIIIERGLGARFSVAHEDNTLFFVGNDKLVYQFVDFTPKIISTPALATKIAAFSEADVAAAVGQFMDIESHKFYILSFPTATVVYDITTGLWADWETSGGVWTGQMVIKAFGKTLVGDRVSGQIYQASPDVYTDAGTDVISIVRYPPVFSDRERVPISSIECELDSGEGPNEGEVTMRLSKDGRNWGIPRTKSFGKIGEFKSRAIFRKPGLLDRQLHVEFAISSHVPRRITGGWING